MYTPHKKRRFGIGFGFFPLNFLGAMVWGRLCLEPGHSPAVMIGVTLMLTIALITVAECIRPGDWVWNLNRVDVGPAHLSHVISQTGMSTRLESGIKVALVLPVVAYGHMESWLWPVDGPLRSHLVLTLIIGLCLEYWWHLFCYEHSSLWRLHAIHFSPQRLFGSKSDRLGPFDILERVFVSLMVVLSLGASRDVVAMMGICVSLYGLYQHCTVALPLSALTDPIRMAQLPFRHRPKTMEKTRVHRGNKTIFSDVVIGMVSQFQDRKAPAKVELGTFSACPTNDRGQLMSLVRWARFHGESKTYQDGKGASEP